MKCMKYPKKNFPVLQLSMNFSIFLSFMLAQGIKEHQSEPAKQDLAKKAGALTDVPGGFLLEKYDSQHQPPEKESDGTGKSSLLNRTIIF